MLLYVLNVMAIGSRCGEIVGVTLKDKLGISLSFS